ncbi:MAG: hypothetical protein ACI837_001508 [Crocinitomicaceae bacterium]|jgi:hypothetical protein
MSIKSLLIVFACLSIHSAFAQGSDAATKAFWNDNMLTIARLDAPKIVSQTNFPLEGQWSFMLDLEDGGSEAEYRAKLSEIFPAAMRKKIKTEDYHQLAAVEMDGEVAFITYTYTDVTIEDGEKYESMTFYSFEKLAGKWKLVSISYAG